MHNSPKKKVRKLGSEGVRSISPSHGFSKPYEGFDAYWLREKKNLPLSDLWYLRNLKSISKYHVYLINSNGKILEKPNSWLNLTSIGLQKAFDLVNQNVLVQKLITKSNIDFLLMKVADSFLGNISQAVKYQYCYYSSFPFHNGVAQGTLLGPPFFLLSTVLLRKFPTDGNLLMTLCSLKSE